MELFMEKDGIKINNLSIPTFEEYVEDHGELLNLSETRHYLGMSREFLLDLLEKEVIPRDKYAIVNVDLKPKKDAPTAKHYFNKEWAESFRREDIGYTLKEIAKILGVRYGYLRDVSFKRPELIEEGRISRYFWDLQWFKNNLPQIHEKMWSKRGKWRKSEFYDMLTEEQQTWIEDYLVRRANGEGIMVGRKIEWNKKPVKPEKAIPEWRKRLALIFYKIICGRADIQNYYVMDRPGKLRELTDEEHNLFDDEKQYFRVIDFSPKDIEHIRLGYMDTTFGQINESVLTPFLYFVLSKLKEDWIELKQKLKSGRAEVNPDDVLQARELYEDFEIAVETSLSKAPTRIETSEEHQTLSVFLTHEQVLLGKNAIRNSNLNDPIKKSLIFMIGCLIGIRPDELAHLKIENFLLDAKTKLLKRYKFDHVKGDFVELNPEDPDYLKGYGRLWIEYNKGGYSKSQKDLGTLVVPRLVTLINTYLEHVLYKSNPDAKGKGYLIRPKVELPYFPYTASGLTNWLTPFSTEHFVFLPDGHLKLLKLPNKSPRESFKYYDVRHTVYNLFMKTNVNRLNHEIKERAAQIHVRHDVNKKRGNTGRVHYTSDISLEEYYIAVDSVLNFPWDLGQNKDGEFYDWADQHGIISKTPEELDIAEEEIEVEINANLTDEQIAELRTLQGQLKIKTKAAERLANGPSGQFKDVDLWVKETVKLDKEIKALQKKINLLA